jgi:hypothetical protein
VTNVCLPHSFALSTPRRRSLLSSSLRILPAAVCLTAQPYAVQTRACMSHANRLMRTPRLVIVLGASSASRLDLQFADFSVTYFAYSYSQSRVFSPDIAFHWGLDGVCPIWPRILNSLFYPFSGSRGPWCWHPHLLSPLPPPTLGLSISFIGTFTHVMLVAATRPPVMLAATPAACRLPG